MSGFLKNPLRFIGGEREEDPDPFMNNNIMKFLQTVRTINALLRNENVSGEHLKQMRNKLISSFRNIADKNSRFMALYTATLERIEAAITRVQGAEPAGEGRQEGVEQLEEGEGEGEGAGEGGDNTSVLQNVANSPTETKSRLDSLIQTLKQMQHVILYKDGHALNRLASLKESNGEFYWDEHTAEVSQKAKITFHVT